MIYQFRVTLPGIKGFYRIYKVNSANTLYSFHKQLQADLTFPADQAILFKAYDSHQEVLARYALIDLGFGTVDDITIGQTVSQGIESFDYYYDTKAKKRIILTLEASEAGNEIKVPTLLDDAKGPEPAAFDNGFVAFEDLPKEKRRLPDDEESGLSRLLDALGDDDEDYDDEEDEDYDEEDEDEDYDEEDEDDYEEDDYEEDELKKKKKSKQSSSKSKKKTSKK